MADDDEASSSRSSTPSIMSRSTRVTPSDTSRGMFVAESSCENEPAKNFTICEEAVGSTMRNATETSIFDSLPDLAMQCIFETFDLKDRCRASQVNRRWHYLLTERFTMDDITVLNIFQNSIYEEKISNNKNIGLKCYHIGKTEMLLSVLQHCRFVSSVKIWFWSSAFAGKILNMLRKQHVRMRCLDLYPYQSQEALEETFEAFPDLAGMTMRPHGTEYFWTGLDLYNFPHFQKMDTLMLDGFNLMPEVSLPTSLTTLEWLNRSGEFLVVMPKLKQLVNLEYLMLGHAEFSSATEFDNFMNTISSSYLPHLQYLLFRYCKIDVEKGRIDRRYPSSDHSSGNGTLESAFSSLDMIDTEITLGAMQMIKFDLCYGNITAIIRRILPHTGPNFRAISLNVISEEANLDKVYEIAEEMEARKLILHFGILQKDMGSSERRLAQPKLPPASFSQILTKFEASFVTDATLLATLLLSDNLPKLADAKFIQCSALGERLLLHLAVFAPRLRKLSLINCSSDDADKGLIHFVGAFNSRVSRYLQIIWKRKRSRPAALYLELVNEHVELVKGLSARFYAKKFPGNKDGERITIWDKKSKKYLYIQDFDSSDQGRILGIVMPKDIEIDL